MMHPNDASNDANDAYQMMHPERCNRKATQGKLLPSPHTWSWHVLFEELASRKSSAS